MRATAPYRFVRLNDVVIPTPLSDSQLASAHSDPLKASVSATIDVDWIPETPLLIGQDEGQRETSEKGEAGVFGPMMLAGKYVIPGASLRGMLRSVMEIVAFARLRQLNAHHRYGTRDFTPNGYYHQRMLGPEADAPIGAGWMWRDPSTREVRIRPCQWTRIAISELAGNSEAAIRNWRTLELAEKYERLNLRAVGPGDETLAWTDKTARKFMPAADHDGFSLTTGSGEPGYLVVSGRATNANANKHFEYVFYESTDEDFLVHPAVYDNFDLIHSKPSKNARVPDGSWAALKPLFEAGQSIPVFYRREHRDALRDASDPAVSNERAVALIQLGLTRLFKLPAELSVGDVLRGTSCHRYGPADRPDMVDALFGYVDEVGDRWQADYGSRDARRHEPSPASALRSRIAFGMARLENPAAAKVGEPQEVIMMGPRASFAPFYLVGTRLDYSTRAFRNGTPTLAGRKRYPSRYPKDQGGLAEEELNKRLAATLKDPEGNPLSGDARSRIRFLFAEEGHELRFKSRIRLHNVHPFELGALLWSLMLLDPNNIGQKATLHALGRAKNFGCGQLRVESFDLRVVAHDETAKTLIDVGGVPGWIPDKPTNVKPWYFVKSFLDYANGCLEGKSNKKWEERLELVDLINTASPKRNGAVRESNPAPDPWSYLDRDDQGHKVPGHRAHAAFKKWSVANEQASSSSEFIRRLQADG